MRKYAVCLALVLAALCFTCCTAVCEATDAAPAADVAPLPLGAEDTDPENGWHGVRLDDIDKADEGWFTLMLYECDRYDPEQIKNLKAGNTILVNGDVYTVTGISSRDIGWFDEEDIIWELETEEECWGGLWFREYTKDTFAAYLDEWIPCTFIGSLKVTLPLDDNFRLVAYPGGEDPYYMNAEEFLVSLKEDDWGSVYNEYNTDCELKDGKLISISRSGYPHGPSDGDEDDDDDWGDDDV